LQDPAPMEVDINALGAQGPAETPSASADDAAAAADDGEPPSAADVDEDAGMLEPKALICRVIIALHPYGYDCAPRALSPYATAPTFEVLDAVRARRCVGL